VRDTPHDEEHEREQLRRCDDADDGDCDEQHKRAGAHDDDEQSPTWWRASEGGVAADSVGGGGHGDDDDEGVAHDDALAVLQLQLHRRKHEVAVLEA
jgi:hypothetical protein